MSFRRLPAAALMLLVVLFTLPPLQAGPVLTPNMVLEGTADGLARIDVVLTSKGLGGTLKLSFKGDKGTVFGGIALPTEYTTSYDITAYNTDGKATHSGKGTIPSFTSADKPLTLALPPLADGPGLALSLTKERFALSVKGDMSDQVVHLDILDPLGNPTKIDPLDIRWTLSDVRTQNLLADMDRFNPHVVPNKDLPPPIKFCATQTDAVICLPNGHCRNVPVCTDPWVTVSAGGTHTCGITKAGIAYCWGSNGDGQLGAPTTTNCSQAVNINSTCSKRPLAVECPTGAPCRFTQISAGQTITAAIDTNGDAWWWGRGGTTMHKVNAVLAGVTQKFSLVAAGFGHGCAISQQRSEIWCWGANGYGEAGVPKTTMIEVPDWQPVRVLPPFTFKKIVAGGEHTCAVASAGTDVACWGRDDSKQTTGTSSVQAPAGSGFYFQQFGGLVSINDVAASVSSSCVTIGNANGVKCWGVHAARNLIPFGVPDKLTAGEGQVCTILSGAASCVGTNNWGELGIGSMASSGIVTPVKAPPATYTTISAGDAHTCGVTPSGDAYCWGDDLYGQVGNGATAYSVSSPTMVVAP